MKRLILVLKAAESMLTDGDKIIRQELFTPSMAILHTQLGREIFIRQAHSRLVLLNYFYSHREWLDMRKDTDSITTKHLHLPRRN